MFDPYEYVDNHGTWNIWQNGKVIAKISGTTIPTSDVIREAIKRAEYGE